MRLRLADRPRALGVAADWAVVLAGLAGAQGLTALSLVVVARRAPPLEFGQYLAAQTLAALLVVLPGAGLEMWLLARGGDRAQLAPLWRGALRTRLGLLALWGAGLAALAPALPAAAFPPALLGLAVLGVAAESLGALAHAALRRLGAHRWVAACQSAGALALLAAALALPLAPGRLALFAGGRALLAAVAAGVALALAVRRLPAAGAPAPARPLLRAAAPFLVGDLAVSVYLRADLVVVSATLGAAGASVYGPALNVLNACFLAPTALYLLVLPALARRGGEPEGPPGRAFVRLAVAQLGVQAGSGLALAAALYALAPALVALLFGPAYAAAGDVLRLLSPALALKSLSFGLGAVLTTAGQQPARTGVQVVAAAASVAANLAVVGTWGVPGVAAVAVATEALIGAGYGLAALRWWRLGRRRVAPAGSQH